MNKEALIYEIMQRNQTAEPALLMAFDEDTLETYLRRLTLLTDRRGRGSEWVRDGSSPAIVTRRHAPAMIAA